MALVVKQDETSGPIQISVLGAEGIVLDAESVPHLIQQLPGARGVGHTRESRCCKHRNSDLSCAGEARGRGVLMKPRHKRAGDSILRYPQVKPGRGIIWTGLQT